MLDNAHIASFRSNVFCAAGRARRDHVADDQGATVRHNYAPTVNKPSTIDLTVFLHN